MTPPPATPKKRARRHSSDKDHIPRYASNTPPRQDWSTSIKHLMKTVAALWNDLPLGDDGSLSPDQVLNGYCTLLTTLSDVTVAVDNTCQIIAQRHNLAYHWQPPALSFETQPSSPPPPPAIETATPLPPVLEEPEPEPEPEPTPLPCTYASVASTRPQRQRQAPPRKPPATKPMSPVRLVVRAKDSLTLPIRNISAPEFFRRLTAACIKVPGSPAPLGVQWNRRNSLILSFPAGTTRTSIKLLYPTVRVLLGSSEQPIFRFDIPWNKIHLANIRARDSPDFSIASEEELRQTLQLNPAIRTLAITVQPTWLKKPGDIAGTHTSAVIAFEDPDGSIARTLLKSTIFAFGEAVTIKKWHNRPCAGS